NASQLPTAQCPLREVRAHFRSGQFPGKVRNKNLAHIKVRQRSSCTLVEEEGIEQPVRISIVGYCRRERVDALAPRICTAHLDAVTLFFCDHHLQRVIEGMALPQHSGDTAKVWIQLLAAVCRRKEIACWCQRRQNHVEIIDSEGLMHSS